MNCFKKTLTFNFAKATKIFCHGDDGQNKTLVRGLSRKPFLVETSFISGFVLCITSALQLVYSFPVKSIFVPLTD